MAPTSGRLENDEDGSPKILLQSFAMIIFSEIGDKTFLIAAILAMRHPRLLVFAGAFGSLVVMSILSAEMGHFLPTLIPRSWTQMAASILFLSFGGKMFLEARQMKAGNEKIQEEMREAQEEIEDDDAVHVRLPTIEDIPLEVIEQGEGVPNQTLAEDSLGVRPPVKGSSVSDGARNFCSLFLGQVFVQAFVLTFLGEWGDRSQIATIALGAAHVSSPFFSVFRQVPLKKFLERISCDTGNCRRTCMLYGVGCCRREISINQNLSQTWYYFFGILLIPSLADHHYFLLVTFGGSLLFLLFGVIYLYEGIAMSPGVEMSIPISPEA